MDLLAAEMTAMTGKDLRGEPEERGSPGRDCGRGAPDREQRPWSFDTTSRGWKRRTMSHFDCTGKTE
jgi:hypothetical protein